MCIKKLKKSLKTTEVTNQSIVVRIIISLCMFVNIHNLFMYDFFVCMIYFLGAAGGGGGMQRRWRLID